MKHRRRRRVVKKKRLRTKVCNSVMYKKHSPSKKRHRRRQKGKGFGLLAAAIPLLLDLIRPK